METVGEEYIKPEYLEFRSYLRGMETFHNPRMDRGRNQFRSYLRGMETREAEAVCGALFPLFRSYLRGMETGLG